MGYSLGRLAIHGLVSPTLMIWMSNDCRHACKTFMANLLSQMFKRHRNECNELILSSRSRALLQARLATEWRNQQTCSQGQKLAQGNPPHLSASVQALPTLINQLHTQLPSMLPRANLIHVRPLAEAQHTPGNVGNLDRSEVILRCSQLRPMRNIPDPVLRINSFSQYQ